MNEIVNDERGCEYLATPIQGRAIQQKKIQSHILQMDTKKTGGETYTYQGHESPEVDKR